MFANRLTKDRVVWVLLVAVAIGGIRPTRADDASRERQIKNYRERSCAYWIAGAARLPWSMVGQEVFRAASALEKNDPEAAAAALSHMSIERLPADWQRELHGFALLSMRGERGLPWAPDQESRQLAILRKAIEEWCVDAELAQVLTDTLQRKARAASRSRAKASARDGSTFNPIVKPFGASPPAPPAGGGGDPPNDPPGGWFDPGPGASELAKFVTPSILRELIRLAAILDDDDDEDNRSQRLVSTPSRCGGHGWLKAQVLFEIEKQIRDRLTDSERLAVWVDLTRGRASLAAIIERLVLERISARVGRPLTKEESSQVLRWFLAEKQSYLQVAAVLKSSAPAAPCFEPEAEDAAADEPEKPAASPTVKDSRAEAAPAPNRSEPVEFRIHPSRVAEYLRIDPSRLTEVALGSVEAGPYLRLRLDRLPASEMLERRREIERVIDRHDAADPELDGRLFAAADPLARDLQQGVDPGQIRRVVDVTALRCLLHERRWREMVEVAEQSRAHMGPIKPRPVVLDEGERLGSFTRQSLDNMILLLEIRARVGLDRSAPIEKGLAHIRAFLDDFDSFEPYLEVVDGESVFLRRLVELADPHVSLPKGVERLGTKGNETRLAVAGNRGAKHVVTVVRLGGATRAFVERTQL